MIHHILFLTISLWGCCLAAAPLVQITGNKIAFRNTGVKEYLKVVFVSDLHLGETDGRDSAYRDNYQRMAQYRQAASRLSEVITKARKADLLILGGDIMSFPSLANVEHVTSSLAKCPIPWRFINGNHDWHFEGLPGSEKDLRMEWSDKRLAALFQKQHPLMSTMNLKGLKLIFIDDSVHEILPQQLDFFQREIADGRPALLIVHIPLYVPGRGLGFSVGHPDWNAAHDSLWNIEGRQQWPETGHTQVTMDFCHAVWSAPNLLGIVAGHTHHGSADFYCGKVQLVSSFGARGEFLELTFY